MKLEHVITLVLAAFFASGTVSTVGAGVNETELFIIGFDITEGSTEEENLKDMAEQMGGSYISAEDATTAVDLEEALIRSFAGIRVGATETVPLLELRGPVAIVEDGARYLWGPQEFAGFYYNIDENIGTESLTLIIDGDALEEPNGVIYRTGAQQDDFEFEEWGEFWTIAFMAEEYFAGYVEGDYYDAYLYEDSTDTNLMVDEQLTKILINDDEERTFTTGTPLTLVDGYELFIQEIDVDNGVYVQLMKGGQIVDSALVEPSQDGATIQDKTYTYTMDMGDTEDIVVIAVHFKNAMHLKSSDQDLTTVDGIWQISETPINIEEDTEYDKMTIQTVNADTMSIMMDNEDEKITLNRNKDTLLMENVRIVTADQDVISAEEPLRFYLYKETTEPGTYEIRGDVKQVVDGATVEWNALSFAGFYYDIDDNLGTERITMVITSDALEEWDGVVYETTAQQYDFDFEDWGRFWTIAFMAEEYFAGYVEGDYYDAYLNEASTDTNLMFDEQLTKVLINDDEERTVTTGTPLKLEEGYELVIQEIDVDNNWVYVQLMKNGMVIDSAVVEPSKQYATIEDKTYTYKKNMGDTRDVVVIAVHFKNAIHLKSRDQDLATVDGIWQISEMPINVEEDTEYGKMTIQTVNADILSIMMDNEDEKITLNKNKDTRLMGDIRIKTANQDATADDPLRFYIYKVVTVES